MKRFFAVDRAHSLFEGMIVPLLQFQDITFDNPLLLPDFTPLYEKNEPEQDLQNHVNTLFPKGVSIHGNRYFLDGHSQFQIFDPNIELIFEYTRKSCFSDKPSRFESFFACETEEEANSFLEKYGQSSDLIWEIESEDFFRADMNLLNLNNNSSILIASYQAHRYWSGLPNGIIPPFWEYLLPLPVQVIKLVN